MSGIMVRLHWSVVVDDSENWDNETAKALYENHTGESDWPGVPSPNWPEDWVAEQLNRVMQEAGDKFIQAHPSLFRGPLV